jgi:hypothetical protein
MRGTGLWGPQLKARNIYRMREERNEKKYTRETFATRAQNRDHSTKARGHSYSINNDLRQYRQTHLYPASGIHHLPTYAADQSPSQVSKDTGKHLHSSLCDLIFPRARS